MSRKKVLILPAGTERSLEVVQAVAHSVHLDLVVAQVASSDDPGSESGADLPPLDNEGFPTAFAHLVQQQAIDLVFPTEPAWVLHPVLRRSASNSILVATDPTAWRSGSADVDLPQQLGSWGVGPVDVDPTTAGTWSVDCFTDRHGVLRFVGVQEWRADGTWIGPVTDIDRTAALAEGIGHSLRVRGPWSFWIHRMPDGTRQLRELAPGLSTTMGYFRHRSVNLPLLSLFDAMDLDIAVEQQDLPVQRLPGARALYRYALDHRTVYLDLDDTLIIRDAVDATVWNYVLQCNERGIPVHLITKHARSVPDTLAHYRIDPRVFTSIIHVPMEAEKSDHMDPEGAIFIDNWYKERKQVRERLGIPVFDVDQVSSLLR